MATAASIRVLVVDDSEDARFLIGILLDEEPDIEVVGSVPGAEEALAALSAGVPDVVLMDARMPVVDGFELTAHMLVLRPGLPVVLLTSLVDDLVRERARAAGAVACASKGDLDTLGLVVRAAAAPGGIDGG